MLYKWWKNKIQTWQLVIKISIDKKEQAIVALLELLKNNTKVKKAVSEFVAAELNPNRDIEPLIAKLDSVFQSETIDEA